REALRDADKKDTRILIQSHPEVMVVPPDPPQMLIKIGQVRKVIDSIYYKPVEAKRKVYIFTESSFMKEAANSLLKVLEEPPEFATLFLLTDNIGELLPTVRSRCVSFTLSSLPTSEIADFLERTRPDWNARQRQLVARLAGGAVGKARSFDLEVYAAARKDALLLLQAGMAADDHSALFRMTESYRAGAEGKDKTEQLIRASYSILEDLLFIKAETPELVRNTDIQSEFTRLAGLISFDWITQAAYELGRVETGMRRNLLRSLSLDAMAASLEK
ncbi:MAG: DNA polymerase III subunit delta', partial [Terriglobales bacterium]